MPQVFKRMMKVVWIQYPLDDFIDDHGSCNFIYVFLFERRIILNNTFKNF